MAYREVQFYFRMCKETGRKRNLSTFGMFCVGMAWPHFRLLWWKLNKGKKDGR